MIQLAEYLKLGYRGIVFLGVQEWEEKTGYHDDHTLQTLVCFDKDGQPLKLEIHWVEKYRPNGGGRDCEIRIKQVIDQNEYEELVKKYGVQDDLLYYQGRAKREYQMRKARVEIDALIPKCPVCGTQMTLKLNRNTGAPFWGCSGFSRGKCRATLSISRSDYQKYSNLSKVANLF